MLVCSTITLYLTYMYYPPYVHNQLNPILLSEIQHATCKCTWYILGYLMPLTHMQDPVNVSYYNRATVDYTSYVNIDNELKHWLPVTQRWFATAVGNNDS